MWIELLHFCRYNRSLSLFTQILNDTKNRIDLVFIHISYYIYVICLFILFIFNPNYDLLWILGWKKSTEREKFEEHDAMMRSKYVCWCNRPSSNHFSVLTIFFTNGDGSHFINEKCLNFVLLSIEYLIYKIEENMHASITIDSRQETPIRYVIFST